jgi:RND family efflux transporter MFP subunit
MNGLGRVVIGPRTARSKLRHRLLPTVIALAAAGIIAIGLFEGRSRFVPGTAERAVQGNETIPLVTTAEAERRPMVWSLSVGGTLVARHELSIGAETSGSRIESVLVDQGDRVAKGQVLARLDTAVLQAQLRRAAGTAQEAASAAASAAADFKRADGIRGTGAISLEQVDQRRAAARSAAARLAAAEAEVGELQARIAKAELRAPADGVIVTRNAEPGAITAAGGEPLFRLIEGGLVQFDAQVPQDKLQKLTPGLEAELRIGAHGEEASIKGSIRAIAPTLDPQSRLGIVHIALPLDPRLRPGAFVQGRIVLSRAPALSTPRSAIMSQDGESFVYVIDGKHARRRIVETGAAEEGQVEIRKGLAEGEHVILSAGAFLYDGQAVRETAAGPQAPAGPPPGTEMR